MNRAAWLMLLGAALTACGGTSGPPPTVLVEIGDEDAGAPGTIEELVRDDARAAVEILTGGLTADDRDLAAWCGIYLRRLGVEHDRGQSATALVDGSGSGDQLVRALSWRRIAADPGIEAPAWTAEDSGEPLVGLFAALAHARAGALPGPLEAAAGMPPGKPRKSVRAPARRVEQLRGLDAAFDDGALGLGIAFLEARRERWTEPGRKGRRRWVAERLRDELAEAVLGAKQLPPPLGESADAEDPTYSNLTELVDTPLVGAPSEVLRGAVLKGRGTLRIGALRALAVAATAPRAGDLGASSAALRSEDPLVRVEAARTYLLLTARATE